jgi:prepilin-type N-terminal cleavage/methylation domain-containing protein
MKTQFHRRAHGFTLVELLVVIAIIAVLAGAGFAAGNAAIQKAKKTTAMATCIALESAINNFYTEYGAMPTSASTDEIVDTKDGNSPLLKALLGLEGTGANVLNTRGIKFLSVKEGKNKMNGIVYNTTGSAITGIFDPWGGTYKVVLDADYDEKVKPTPKGGGTAITLNGRRAAAWSDGADGKGAAPGKTADDVVTWNK